MSEKPSSFVDVVVFCANDAEFVAQYDRLFNGSLGKLAKRHPIERAVDKATGFERDEYLKFTAFVWEFVWTRLPDEAFADAGVVASRPPERRAESEE